MKKGGKGKKRDKRKTVLVLVDQMERTLRKHGRWVTNAVAQVRVVW